MQKISKSIPIYYKVSDTGCKWFFGVSDDRAGLNIRMNTARLWKTGGCFAAENQRKG